MLDNNFYIVLKSIIWMTFIIDNLNGIQNQFSFSNKISIYFVSNEISYSNGLIWFLLKYI